ncbi:MAG TPA: deoxyribonuclease IV [Clostridia bacterium]|nr:deoxyribonuclease IV [Clostridia bacterium]
MILGAHVSIAGGVANAPQNALDCTCDTFQIFTKSQLQWQAPPLSRDEIAAFKRGMRSGHLVPGTVHAAYLVNLAAREPALLAKSRDCMVSDLGRTERLGIPYLVVHPGAHRGQGAQKGIEVAARSLNFVFRHSRARRTMILLEATTGAGSVLGGTFEELAVIRAGCRFPARVGFCIDTCHIFGAGYDIRSREGYAATIHDLDRALGLDNVRAFHLNDSTGALGSKIDRHAEIGEGEIGLEPFRLLLSDTRFARTPGILETPGGDGAYARNLAVLRSLIPSP